MHKELWQQLAALDGEETSKRSKCQYLLSPQRYVITLLGSDYVVDLSQKQISPVQESCTSGAGFLEQLCILAYLIGARDLPLSGRLVKAESFPGGAFFFRGPHVLPTENLKEVFGSKPELLYDASRALSGKKCDFGDAAVEMLMVPRIPVTFVIWAGDEEFESRASILFDQSAGQQLPLDALLAGVNLAVDAVIKSVGTDS